MRSERFSKFSPTDPPPPVPHPPSPTPDNALDEPLDWGELAGLERSAIISWEEMNEADSALVASLSSASPYLYANEPGQSIGPYLLIEKLGEGGFGIVWRAEQTFPICRQVALKVIKIGMDTMQVVARFNAERQALALMDHPGIASVYEAGATQTGRPYFVMELVEGAPITLYCERHELTLAQRLRLFIEVCKAVQHAHQKGILHRDLKPPNILVAEVDGQPQPKVIDFGIAKALDADLLFTTQLATRGDLLLGTPEYMSPEQAIPGNLDLDTRTDIYSLGVVLHEMLTGQTPKGRLESKTGTLSEVLESMRQLAPRLPSSVVRSLSTSAAAGRSSPSAELARQLKGDLDWILLKALAQNRTDRYESADALAADLVNHLADLPISAGKPSAIQTTLKFIRRNRTVVAAAAALITFLAVATVLTTRSLSRESKMRKSADALRLHAEAQTQKAELTLGFLTRLLERTGEHVKSGKNPEALRLALEELTSESHDVYPDPDVQQAIAGKTAIIFRALRDDTKVLPLVEQQMRYLKQTRPEDDADLLAARELFARTLYLQGQPEESQQEYDALVRFWEARLDTKDGPRRLFLIRRNRADVWTKTGRLHEALTEFADIRATATPEIRQHSSWPVLLRNHAEALSDAGRLSEAEKTFAEALEHCPIETSEQKHTASAIHQRHGAMLVKIGNVTAAISALEKAIALEQEAKGADSPWLPEWRVMISRLYTARDLHDQAVTSCQSALEAIRRTGQWDRLPHTQRAHADNLEAAGHHEAAATAYGLAAELEKQKQPPPPQAWINQSRAMIHSALSGRWQEAARFAQSVEEIRQLWYSDAARANDLLLLDSALAVTAALTHEHNDNREPAQATTLENAARRLGTQVLQDFLVQAKKKNPFKLPVEVVNAMESALTRPSTPIPTSADFLAFDQALTDRWRGEDMEGEWFYLAAALRLMGQPDAAISLYQIAACQPPGKAILLSRRHQALVLAAETHLSQGRIKESQSVLATLNANHHSGKDPITNAIVLQRLTTLLAAKDS